MPSLNTHLVDAGVIATSEYQLDAPQLITYALGVGAKQAELDFLYEGRGPQVLPTFAVVPAYAICASMFEQVGGDPKGVVHASQGITLHQPLKVGMQLKTTGKVTGMYDLKRFAQVVFLAESYDNTDTLVCSTEWSMIYRFDGNFGGTPPPRSPRFRAPDRPADFRVEERIPEEQALLYRLSGDPNPLHADPEFAQSVGFDRPILHGLCTYGYMGRAIVHQACGGDASRLLALRGQFRKPVFPGDTLITQGWRDGEQLIISAETRECPGEIVFGNACAQLA